MAFVFIVHHPTHIEFCCEELGKVKVELFYPDSFKVEEMGRRISVKREGAEKEKRCVEINLFMSELSS